MLIAFLSALLALVTVGLLLNKRSFAATALILLGDWLAGNVTWLITDDQHPWMMLIVIDWLAGLSILAFRDSRWQLAVIAIFVGQIICHVAYGVMPHTPWTDYNYWWALTYSGWAQLIIMGGWLAHELAGRIDGARRRAASARAYAERAEP